MANQATAESKTGNKPEPKIHLPMAVFIGLSVLLLDIVDIIPGAGDITDIPSLGVNFYLYSIGVSGIMFLVAEILDLFPVLQEFPTRTIAWIATVLFEWIAPAKVERVVEAAGEMGEGAEGAEGKEGAQAGAEGGANKAKPEAAVEDVAAVHDVDSAGERMSEGSANSEGRQSGENGGPDEQSSLEEERQKEWGEGGEEETEGATEEDREKDKRDEELEKEMETGAERSPEEEAGEEDFALQDAASQSDSEEEDEEDAHNQAVKSGKVIVMKAPQAPQGEEVPLPNIDEIPKPKKKAA